MKFSHVKFASVYSPEVSTSEHPFELLEGLEGTKGLYDAEKLAGKLQRD